MSSSTRANDLVKITRGCNFELCMRMIVTLVLLSKGFEQNVS